MDSNILEMKNISKSFPGVKALDNVSLYVKKGQVHCLMGENGAGKSTLIKILAGSYSKDAGDIYFEGKEAKIMDTFSPYKLGMSFIHQELSVVDTLTVEENMTLGFENYKLGIINKNKNIQKAIEIINKLNIELDPKEKVINLSASKKQMMLIAKALSLNSKLIVMDEPTSSLTNSEAQQLFRMIESLKYEGVSFIYISHRFEDIFTIGDEITVFRDGQNVGNYMVNETTEDEIIKCMVGRELVDTFPKVQKEIGDEILKVEDLTADKLIEDVSFTLRKGEILGVSGLAGAGKSELAKALFGVNKIKKGKIFLKNKEVKITCPKKAVKEKIALLPEERRSEGIVGVLSVRNNISLASNEKISKLGIIQKRKDKQVAEKYIRDINIKTPSYEQKIKFLSGGNQQKVLIGKWLNTEPEILLLDEPTRGIDVGAKSEIYELINMMAKSGKSIIMFSSEMPELIGVCDNIMVLNKGRIAGIIKKSEFSQEKIMELSIS